MHKENQDAPQAAQSDTKEQTTQSATGNSETNEAIETTDTSAGWFKGLKTKTLASTTSLFAKGKQKAAEIHDKAQVWASQVDTEALKTKDFYIERFKQYSEYSLDKVTTAFKSTFEIDKTTADMVQAIKGKLPMTPSDAGDIFEQCKKEALQRAIASFCLAPVMQGLDAHSENKYANLSLDYQEFRNSNNLHDHANFAAKNNERYEARQAGAALQNGYHEAEPLNPWSTDIEHVTSKKEIYDNWLLRMATTDDELINIMNDDSNLLFANESVNRSKGSQDLMDYIDAAGVPVPGEQNLVQLEINGQLHTVNKNDIRQAYETSKSTLAQRSLQAVGEIGSTAASAGVRMAMQQVVGLMVFETIDIMVDEIKDITVHGNLLSSQGLKQSLIDKKNKIHKRLAGRFEERQILQRAKALGIESGVAGALSVIPQIAISLITRMPAFILSMVREGTLSVVRCVRVFLDPSVDKYDSLKAIMAGTATAVCGVYVAHVISNAIKAVPMLNAFNRQVTDVLSAVFIAALSLSVVYFVDKHKTQLLFALKRS